MKQALIKNFWKSRNLFIKRFLAAGGKEYEWAILKVLQSAFDYCPFVISPAYIVVTERSTFILSVRHKVLKED